MADQRWIRMWDIYHEALNRVGLDVRRKYLDTACAGDHQLRTEIEELLASTLDLDTEDPLDSPETALAEYLEEESSTEARSAQTPPGVVSTMSDDDTGALQPARVGNYRLGQILGEGGMGVVYEAEQEFPSRLVAVKMIRPGVVTDSVSRRFEREVELLGRLRHPGVVQIYDAGLHETVIAGATVRLPWFAMERVEGRPITEHAREHQLSVLARLELLVRLCDVVQYAHDRGVIHRDLKPANILIDDRGEPRVLDFGIARAVDLDAHESSHLETMTGGAVMGTIAYMSPEQLGGASSEIDVRTDVYSLGVIGYELLTDRLPHDVRSMSIVEAVRTVTEIDAQPPSRHHPKLGPDVDVILGKALQRSLSDRYQTVAELAADLQCHLRGEPVLTRGISRARRTWRLLRRHQALTIGSAACVAALVLAQLGGVLAAFVALGIGLIGTVAGLIRSTHARVRAERYAALAEVEADKARRIETFLTEMLTSLDPREAQGEELRVRDLLDKAARRASEEFIGQPEIEASICETIGKTYITIGCYEQAHELITHAHAIRVNIDHRESPASAGNIHYQGLVAYHRGRFNEACELLERALAIYGQCGITSSFDRATTHRDLGVVLMRKGDWVESERQYDIGIDMMKSIPDVEPKELASAMSGKAVLYRTNHRHDEARDVYLEILRIFHHHGLAETLDYAALMNNLGVLYSVQLDHLQSEAYFRDALALRRRLLPPEHPEIASILNNLAGSLRMQRRNDEAEPLYRESLEIRRAIFPSNHPDIAMTLIGFGYSRIEAGAADEAEAMLREALDIRRSSLSPDHPRIANAAAALSFCLYKLERYEEARDLLEPAIKVLEREWSLADDRVQKAIARLSDVHARLGNIDLAMAIRTRLNDAGVEVEYDSV